MTRVRLADLQASELPEILTVLPNDPRVAQAINRAQERLMNCPEANEEGFIGSWAEMTFAVDPLHPVITCPHEVGRLEAIDVCGRPVPLHNQFFEFLEFGDGRFPKNQRWGRRCGEWKRQGFERNYAPTFTDIQNPPQQIQIFAVNPADCLPNPQTGAIPRLFVQGLDQNGNIVTSMDGPNLVQGEFITLASPYAISVNEYSTLTGIQKDQTQGQVQIWQSDPIWGAAEILSVMEPSETAGWYRRYYLSGIPHGCCKTIRPIIVNKQPETCDCPTVRKEWVQVTALAKRELVPVQSPTDYTLIQSAEAIIAECQSIRYSKMDDATAKQESALHHKEAIRILQGQGVSREGKNNVAVNFSPFGRADWGRLNLNMK